MSHEGGLEANPAQGHPRTKPDDVDLRKVLKELFAKFRWNAKGILLDDDSLIPIPPNSTCITAIIEQQALKVLQGWCAEVGITMTPARNTREYPDSTIEGGPLRERLVALDVKTTRRTNDRRVSGFTIGSYAGYFQHPDRQMPGCRIPYGQFSEHWIVGFIYTWDDERRSLDMVSDLELIVAEKWRIASRSTGTGTTKHIRSVQEINRLRREDGEFSRNEEFEDYWREYGRRKAA
jgi:hypothetical protein